MLDLGISVSRSAMSRRSFLMGAAGLPALALTGLGNAGVSEGFTALPIVQDYTASEGRFRRAPDGFVRCAANEERLCFDSAGRFVGQALEGPETYFSAAWDDPAAPHQPGDAAHLSGSVAYASQHNEPDIFSGTGGGVVLTSATQNQFHNTSGLAASGASPGDVIRYEAIVAITEATTDGRIEIRGSGNPSFAFTFLHNSAGEITGISTVHGPGQPFDAEYRDLGIINSKHWYHLIVWRQKTGAGDAATGIGFGNIPADIGKKFHICDLRMVRNPQVAPSSWPVCAPNKTFVADTVKTSHTGAIGALFFGGAGRCRTRITDGSIALSADTFKAHDGFSMVTQIGVVASTEAQDRVGLMPYPEMEREFAFWSGGNRAVLFGPARFAVDIDSNKYPGNYDNLTIGNAFTTDPLLRGWIDGRISLSSSQLTGDLTLDDTIIFPTCSTLDDHFEQVDLADLHYIDTAGSNFSAQRALFMSHPSSHSRARHQAQADDDLITSQVYMGRLRIAARDSAGLAMNISDSSFQNMGRAFEPGAVGSSLGSHPMVLTADRTFFYGNWSDSIFFSYGNYAGSSFDNQFHAGFTARRSALYQSRKEIEVDIGGGWQAISSSGLTEDDLPVGRLARHAGTYDFNSQQLDANSSDPSRTTIIRSWHRGSAPGVFDKSGYQFHSQGIDEGTHIRPLDVGETFVIEQVDAPSPSTPHVRFVADWGKWTDANTFDNSGPTNFRPALVGSGTHADALQSTVQDFTFDGVSSDGMVIIGDAQGVYLQGTGPSSSSVVGDVDFTNFIAMTSSVYAVGLISPGHGLQTDFTFSDSLLLPAYAPERDTLGGADNMGNYVAPVFIQGAVDLSNFWFANWQGVTIEAFAQQIGGTITGTPSLIDVPFVQGFDTWVPIATSNPDGRDFTPVEFQEAQSDLPDWRLIGNPIETGFAFTTYAETTTGIPLNSILANALATGVTMKPLTDWLKPWQRDQDFIANVPNNSAIGTKIDVREYQRFRPEANLPVANMTGTALEPRYGNPRPGLIDFDADGDLAVAGDISGIDKPFLLKTDADELILVDVAG
ncbi:MAG: hypothetical protein AAF687_04920 [Pseudomonadota bacterium]